MALPVNLKELAEEMSIQMDGSRVFVNKKTGEIVLVMTEELSAAEEDESIDDLPEWQQEAVRVAREIIESDDYVRAPTKHDIHEYAIMERFCLDVEDGRAQDDLLYAIRGRGAFRMFKDGVRRLGLEQAWYRYRDETLLEQAREWCEEKGIPYTTEK